MATAGLSHDITIADTSSGSPKLGFMLVRQDGKREFTLADYQTIAPRTLTTEELNAAQLPPEVELSLLQDDWRLGIGGRNVRHDAKRLASGSKVETTIEGTLRLARKLTATTVDSNPTAYKPSGFVAYQNSEPWAFIGSDVYQWDYTNKNWDKKTSVMSAGQIARNGVNFGTGTYAPVWTASTDAPARFMKKAAAGNTWAAGGAASDTFKYVEVANDLFFAGHWGSGSENVLKYTSDPSAGTISWTSETIGQTDAPITGLITDGATLLVLKTNGIWARYSDGSIENLTPEFERQTHPSNFMGSFNWNGHILLPLGSGGLLQLYDGRLEDISLKNYAPDQTTLHGRVCAIAGDATSVFLLVVDTTNLKYYLVMGIWAEYQGNRDFRWHQVAEVTYTTSHTPDHATLYAEGVPSGTTYHHRILVGVESTGSNLLPYFYTISTADAEDVFTPDDDGTAVTVAWDANLPKVSKLYTSLDFTTANLGTTVGTHHQIGVKYRVDGGSWTWVTGVQATSTLTTSPQTLTITSEVTGKRIELQFLPLQGTTLTTSPELKDFTIRAALRPTTIKSMLLILYLADGQRLLNGAISGTSKGDLSQLNTWNEQAAEVTLVDPAGTSRDVVFLPGVMKVTEKVKTHKRRAEYLVFTMVAVV